MQEMKEMWVGSLGPEDPLEEGIATHSSILAWRIPGARWATVHGVGKSQTRLEQRNTHARGQGRWLHRQSFNKALPEDSMVWGRRHDGTGLHKRLKFPAGDILTPSASAVRGRRNISPLVTACQLTALSENSRSNNSRLLCSSRPWPLLSQKQNASPALNLGCLNGLLAGGQSDTTGLPRLGQGP